jgi:hypothetical protein
MSSSKPCGPTLIAAAKAALAALETPGDLTDEERGHVIDDLDAALSQVDL